MHKKYETTGREGCDDCQWLAVETEGEFLCCDECAHDLADDGQPDWAQEWEDFGEVYDDEPDYI